MATTGLSFSAQIDAWVRQTEARMKAVRDQSAEDVIELMRRYTPVQYGFLAGTIQATVNRPSTLNRAAPEDGAAIAPNASAGEVSLVIANARLSDTIYGCFTMNYAAFVEYGTSKMAPRAMVQRAAMQWPQIVNRNVSAAKARAGR